MGFISRKLFPACGNMCICCPAMRSRSRQPVKRYKKLLAEIFPKSPECSPNERKIVKCSEKPFQIAKYLEERCYKELRSEHIKFINVIAEVYNKLLCMCKEQICCVLEGTTSKELLPPCLDPKLQAKDLITGVTFASAGSGYDPQTNAILSILSIPKQLELFKEYIGKLKAIVGEAKTSEILSNSLFIVLSGHNDIQLNPASL